MNIMAAMGLSDDAPGLLENDHRAVDLLISQLEGYADEKSSDPNNSIFLQMKQSLTLHAMAEEQIFYPAMKTNPETAKLVPEAYEEHQTIKQLLEQMTGLAPHTSEFQHLLAELKGNITHHVAEEENEMFVKAREVMSSDELSEIGRQIKEFKERETPNVQAMSATS